MNHHYRIDSAGDAQRLVHEHPARDPRKVDAVGHHQHRPKVDHYRETGGLHSGGGGSFAVDLAEFEAALTSLGKQCETFTEKVAKAADLTSALPDGAGPVASVVGHAFNHRLGPDGGVHYAMRTNLEQLQHILAALRTTAANYQEAEQQAHQVIVDQPGGTA